MKKKEVAGLCLLTTVTFALLMLTNALLEGPDEGQPSTTRFEQEKTAGKTEDDNGLSLKPKALLEPAEDTEATVVPEEEEEFTTNHPNMEYEFLDLYQLKVTLKGTNPAVWRRILAAETFSCEHLAWAITSTMGWRGHHQYMFIVDDDIIIGDKPGDPFGVVTLDIKTTRMTDMFANGRRKYVEFVYDFGDNWRHGVRLEKIIPGDLVSNLAPDCLAGAMACPPEDVGGLPGYRKLIEVLKDPGHPEYEDHMEWLDEQGYRNYDPVKFDLSKCNM